MNDDLQRVLEAIRLSRATHRVLWQNFSLALGIMVLVLFLAVFDNATMWMAVFAGMGASSLVVFNGLRLLRVLERRTTLHQPPVGRLRCRRHPCRRGWRNSPLESATMRRWLVVFMLLVLPLQFAWAAAAPYCAHEVATAASKHPGHHQHVHQGGGDVAKAGDDGAGNGANHTDCASCQAGAAATLPLPAAELAAAPREVLREPPAPRYRSHTPSGPERPDIV